MARTLVSRGDIESLCDRLEEWDRSDLLDEMPELLKDLRIAVEVLRRALMIGFPVRPIEIDNGNGFPKT